MRGVTSAGEFTIGVYFDETLVSGPVGTTSDFGGSTPDFRLFNVQRAEVLRGPQGTLARNEIVAPRIFNDQTLGAGWSGGRISRPSKAREWVRWAAKSDIDGIKFFGREDETAAVLTGAIGHMFGVSEPRGGL